MFIHLNDNENPMPDICDALGKDGILDQITEKLEDFSWTAQNVKMILDDKGPSIKDDALVYLTEACADVLLRIDALIELGLVDRTGLQFVGRYKRSQWHKRVCGEKNEQASQRE